MAELICIKSHYPEPLKVHSKMSNFEKFVFWTQVRKFLNYGDLENLLYGLLG